VRSPSSSRIRLGLLCASLAGCGGGQTRGHPFEREWHDESGVELAAFVARWKTPTRPPPASRLLGSVEGRALVGRAEDGPVWRLEHPVEDQPVLAGSMAVAIGGGKLVAVEAKSGHVEWELPAFGRIRGASDDGTTTLVSIESVSGKRSQVLAVARNGTVVRQIVEDGVVGPPLVFDEFAFLPVARSSVIVFDLVTGVEAARILARVPLGRAFLAGDAIYVGDQEVVRFDRDIVAARHGGGTRLALPDRFLPGGPRWETSPVGGPLPRARLLASPRQGAIELYADVAGPFVVGLRGIDARVAWLHVGSSPYLAGRALGRGFAVCNASGEAVVLDDAGRVERRYGLGIAVARCDVSHGGTPAVEAPREATLLGDFAAVLRTPRPEMLDLQLFVLDEVAAHPSGEAVLAEVAASTAPSGEPLEVTRAREALAAHARSHLERKRTSAGTPSR
jgi:outer membrane protein assembly factor BamB